MFQLLLVVLLTASPSAPHTPPASRAVTVDTVVVERLVKEEPRHVRMHEGRTVVHGDTLTRVIGRLQQSGFFRITQDSVAAVCGVVDGSRNRLSIEVHGDTGWQTLVIPDACSPSNAALNDELSSLRTLAWSIIRQHA